MKRRQFLAGTVPAVSVAAGGCVGGRRPCTDEESWPPRVGVEAVELAPGDSDVFDIAVAGITSFRFDTRLYQCGSTAAPVGFGDVDTTPSVDSQADSCPPIWLWDDCTQVTVTVPVHVAPDADVGRYEYGFTIGEDVGERNSRAYEHAVTVTGN